MLLKAWALEFQYFKKWEQRLLASEMAYIISLAYIFTRKVLESMRNTLMFIHRPTFLGQLALSLDIMHF